MPEVSSFLISEKVLTKFACSLPLKSLIGVTYRFSDAFLSESFRLATFAREALIGFWWGKNWALWNLTALVLPIKASEVYPKFGDYCCREFVSLLIR